MGPERPKRAVRSPVTKEGFCGGMDSTVTATPYEALVESASRLNAADTLADFEEHNISDAASLAEQNRHVLDSARHLLTQQCCVPVRYERSFFSDHADDFSHLRQFAQAFRAKTLLAASHEKFATAALIGVDLLELAITVSQDSPRSASECLSRSDRLPSVPATRHT